MTAVATPTVFVAVIAGAGGAAAAETTAASIRTIALPAGVRVAGNVLDPASLADAVRDSAEHIIVLVEAGASVDARAFDAIIAFASDHPDTDVLYGATARLRADDRVHPLRRPDFSPERLRSQYYLGPVVAWRREALLSLDGFRAGVPEAEAYDLALRAVRAGLTFASVTAFFDRVPVGAQQTVLSSRGIDSVRRILEEHLAETGGGEIRRIDPRGAHDVRRVVQGEPLVSIVIPTRGLFHADDAGERCFVLDAVRGIMQRSSYRNVELVIVIDDVAEQRVVDELEALAGDRLKLVWWTEPFNFSTKVNLGALHATGEFILLLNDDVDVITPDWIEALLALAQLPGAGMSGAMLYYDDDTIQHGGHAYYRGDAAHIGSFVPRGSRGPLDGYLVEREVSGVTAACAMMPTAVYHEVGGLTSLLPGAFNDVDLCMKVTWTGHDIYWTPHAELYHFESKTRDPSVHAGEVQVAWGRWGFRMHDPRYWPYPLELTGEDWLN